MISQLIRRLRRRYSYLVTTASLLAGCMLTQAPTATPSATPTPTLTPTYPASWETLAPGLERRLYFPGGTLTQMMALRIDPAYFRFRAVYQPGEPRSVQRWQAALPDAVAFVNSNFFDRSGDILGLLVSNGTVYGTSFSGYGGFFQVQDGQPRVRSNILEPYGGEPLEEAVQAFPMLILNGQPVFENAEGDRVSRRTVVGQDRQGRIVLLVTPLAGLSLVDLSAYLATTDLDLVNALNLDGGGSSMMYIALGSSPYRIRSFDAVPAILAVYRK